MLHPVEQLVQMLLATQGITIEAIASQMQPPNPLMDGGGGEGLTLPSPNGAASGLPSATPTGM